MIELLAVLVVVLAALCVVLTVRLGNKSKAITASREMNDDLRESALRIADRLAENSTLNATEIKEAIAEQNTTVRAVSSTWSVPLPYGKWGEFSDGSPGPAPLIRGYWLGFPGRLIGVKMPAGSMYDLHFHEWIEILVGGSGTIWVEIEHNDGAIIRKKLGPGEVVIIPKGIRHAVARTTEDAEFVCIWIGEQIESHV